MKRIAGSSAVRFRLRLLDLIDSAENEIYALPSPMSMMVFLMMGRGFDGAWHHLLQCGLRTRG